MRERERKNENVFGSPLSGSLMKAAKISARNQRFSATGGAHNITESKIFQLKIFDGHPYLNVLCLC